MQPAPPTIDFRSKISVPADVMISELAGEAVLLNLQNEQYYGLDDTGTRFWSLLSVSPTIEQAFQQLLAEFDVDESTLRHDLATFLDQLSANGLVELVPAAVA